MPIFDTKRAQFRKIAHFRNFLKFIFKLYILLAIYYPSMKKIDFLNQGRVKWGNDARGVMTPTHL